MKKYKFVRSQLRSYVCRNIAWTLVFASFISAMYFNVIANFLKYQISGSLYSSAFAIASIYDENNLEPVKELMTSFKESGLNIDTAIYLANENNFYVGNVKEMILDPTVYEATKSSGLYLNNNADSSGDGYYCCYLALYDKEGQFDGIIYAGRSIDLEMSVLRGKHVECVFLMWVLVIIFIFGICKRSAIFYSNHANKREKDNNNSTRNNIV